jgi:hypothetical protein
MLICIDGDAGAAFSVIAVGVPASAAGAPVPALPCVLALVLVPCCAGPDDPFDAEDALRVEAEPAAAVEPVDGTSSLLSAVVLPDSLLPPPACERALVTMGLHSPFARP